jgi:hypothetical protein
MTMNRHGSEKNHGSSMVKLGSPRFKWDSANGLIAVKQAAVSDFSGQSRHNYHITLSLEELAEILEQVSENAAVDSPGAVSGAFSKTLKALVCLTTFSARGTVLRSREDT